MVDVTTTQAVSTASMPILWRTSVTVAAVIPRLKDDHQFVITPDWLAMHSLAQRQDMLEFLMIEEQTRDGILINQPAGHLEANESPVQASIRETMEETAYNFIPQYFLGTYLCKAISQKDQAVVSYLRLAFVGYSTNCLNTPLDEGILRTFWIDFKGIQEKKSRLRSPLVLACLEDYLNLKYHDLSAVFTDESVYL